MADRHTLHFKHLDKFKKWLVKNEWELKPLSNSPYEVLRAVKNKHWVIIYIKDEAKEHYSLTENSIPVVNQWLREIKMRKKICEEFKEYFIDYFNNHSPYMTLKKMLSIIDEIEQGEDYGSKN